MTYSLYDEIKMIPAFKSLIDPPIGDASLLVRTESGFMIFFDVDVGILGLKPGDLAFFGVP